MSGMTVVTDTNWKVAAPELRLTAVRLTNRGKWVFFLFFLGLVLTIMWSLAGFATATQQAGSPASVRVVQVMPGQTLFQIAGEIAAPGEVRNVVDQIIELNGLASADLQVGQQLAIPK